MDVGFRMLPAGEERLKRAGERGHVNDDPELPLRELIIDRDGRNLTVWVGPVDYGAPEEELWELDVTI